MDDRDPNEFGSAAGDDSRHGERRNRRDAGASGRPGRPARAGGGTGRPGSGGRSGDGAASSNRTSSNRRGSSSDGGRGAKSGARSEGRGGKTGRTWNDDRSRPRRDDSSSGPQRGTDGRRGDPREQARRERTEPRVPDEIVPADLDKAARIELKTLTKENADWVARHLAMAGILIDSDPALAHRHAIAASRKAGRIGIVRETVGLTAYATGDFALALRELRTYRRITGSDEQLPVMVDCERGLGRPKEALELGRSVDRTTLAADIQVELAIAMSGARLDLGQDDEALVELEIPQLDPNTAYPYSPQLYRAYAEVLDGLGRADEAGRWIARAEVAEEAFGIDADGFPIGDDSDVEIVELVDEDEAAAGPGAADSGVVENTEPEPDADPTAGSSPG